MESFSRRKLFILAAAALASILVYWVSSQLTFRPGFPLDDAWIHQTYARNLAQGLDWAFLPGQPSGGATSPLWVMLLVPGYWLGIDPLLWSVVLGFLVLLGLAVAAEFAYSRELWQMQEKPGQDKPGQNAASISWKKSIPWMGLLICLEWHLVWAALSGMETLLFSGMVCLVLILLWKGKPGWFLAGLLCGISTWVRPDGITLLGSVLLLCLIKGRDWRGRLRSIGLAAAGFAILFVPYLVFNQLVNGSFWPNTLFAKQAEYAILRQQPFFERYLGELKLPMVGVGILLLPGWFFLAVRAIRQKDTGCLVGMIWWLAYLALYAARLPVVYQHGRYAIPSMAIFMVWGLVGLLQAIRGIDRDKAAYSIARAWPVAAGIVLAAFWLMGARAYAYDVAVIESEMVDTAHWLAGNTPPDSVIAAHDIGALGFFGKRQILDLAGLISPEVIPFIRDETRIAEYLASNRVDFLVIFPGWYPILVRERYPIYSSGAHFSPQQGGENMVVYHWNSP